jgi:hypothetical protein
MEDILHILNGDATLDGFKQTGLQGDVLVWREVLSAGPLLADVSSAGFWDNRSQWICKTFGDTSDNYRSSVVEPLGKLGLDYREIDLWFEFDLHCQVNLLGVMLLLSRQADLTERSIYLICPSEFPNKPDFRGMGELNGEELAYLYDNIRIALSPYDFKLAAEAWGLYVEADAKRLANWIETTTFWGSLHALKPALKAHLKRLTVDERGLNYIHLTLLDIYNSGIHSRPAIYNKFWATEKIYGMGDAELDTYLDGLLKKGLIKLT